MVQLQVFPASELPPLLKCQILSFMRIVWWEGFAGENHLRDWISRPDRHPLHFVITEAGLVISQTEVLWDYLEHGGDTYGDTYKVYGLSGVLTFPAERRKGYGRRVVDAATAYIDTTDADFAIVNCAPHLKDFYAGSGWIPMNDTKTLVGASSSPDVSDEALLMRFYSEKGRRARTSLEGGALYVGESVW